MCSERREGGEGKERMEIKKRKKRKKKKKKKKEKRKKKKKKKKKKRNPNQKSSSRLKTNVPLDRYIQLGRRRPPIQLLTNAPENVG